MFSTKSLAISVLFALLFSGCFGWGHGHYKKPRFKPKKVHYVSPTTVARFA